MANSSHIPTGNLRELRPNASPALSHDHTNGRLRAVVPEPVLRPDDSASLPLVLPGNQDGPRKLVRPKLPDGFERKRPFSPRRESPILAHETAKMPLQHDHSASHAEAFYFQKQVQTQTLMVFVLEDGEQLEGYIEWYDTGVIKIRNGSRTLIYKSAVKYLYKAGENSTQLDSLSKTR